MFFPGLELYRVESVPRKYFRFHMVLAIREETMILNANWFGLELPFRYYPCCLPVTGPLPMSWCGTALRALRRRARGTATTRRRSLAES